MLNLSLSLFARFTYSLNNVVQQTTHKVGPCKEEKYIKMRQTSLLFIHEKQSVGYPREAIKQCNEKNEQINFARSSRRQNHKKSSKRILI
jgi:hypothetical protein